MSNGELLTTYERSILHPSSEQRTFPEMSTMYRSSRLNIPEDLDHCRINRCHQNLQKLGIKCPFTIYSTRNFKPKWLRKNRAYISRQDKIGNVIIA